MSQPLIIPTAISPLAVSMGPFSPTLEPNERHVLAQDLVRQHLFDQAARAEELNAAVGPGMDSIPVMGDVVSVERPALPRNDAPGGLLSLKQPDAMKVRGYLDDADEITPLGEEFLTLLDEGIFDEQGNLTVKGNAFAMTTEEARDNEDNLEAYMIRDKAGLDKTPDTTSLADTVWNLGRDFARGVGILIGRPAQKRHADRFTTFANMDGVVTEEEKKELAAIKQKEAFDTIALQELGKQTLTGNATLGSGAGSLIGQGLAKLQGNEFKFYAAKQTHDRQVAEFNDASAGELWGGTIGSMETIARIEKSAADAEALIGPEKAEQARREGGAASMLTDPSTILTMGAAGFVSKGGVALSMTAKAEKAALARLAALEATAARASAETVAKRAAELSRRAASRADNLQALGKDSTMARSFSERMAAKSAESWDDVTKLDAVIAERAGDVAKLTKDARVAEALLGMGERARALRAVPFKAFGELAERMGASIIKLDDGLREAATKYGFESVGKVLSSPLTPVAIGAITAGPVGAVVAGAGRALASGPVLKSIGNFSRVVGAETLQRRGMIPFWQRVANNSTLTPVARATAHLLDTATLGGKAGIPLRMAGQAAKGTAAAAPIDMAFEWVAAGGDLGPAEMKQAIAESIIFGGGSGVVAGSRNALQQQQLGDEINFRNGLVDREALAFGRMNPGARRVLSSYAAANPALRFNLTTEGNSFMDRTSNTMTLNTRQSDWMAPIIGHEVSHFVQIKGQMESGITAMLVGDGATGGILRAPDGSLNPDFKRFADAYNGRLVAQGINPLPIGDIAIEYFTESTVDDITTMVESGELARMAGRSNAERMVREMSRNLIGRVPFIRDLSMKFGTGMDRGGRMVMGTGILADGVRTIPGARAMLRGLMREQAGRRGDGVISEESATIPVQIMRDDPAMRSAMFSTLETDAAGNPIVDANGNVSITSRETELRRMAAGLIITELEAERIQNGRQLPEGELAPQTDGSWQGTHLSPEALQRLAESGVFNAKQLAMLGMLNRSAKGLTGETFMMIYQAATIPRKGKRKGYGTLPATFREVVPVGVKITKDGNIIVETMSVTQLVENVRDRAASERGKRLYNGNQVEILRDAQAVLDLHRKGERTDEYFANKYGSINGPEYKNFVNTAFGLMTRSQQDVNPIFAEDKIRAGGVFKSRRLDRINQTTRMQGKPLFRFGYEQVKANLAPNGIPDPNPRMLPAPLTLESPEWKAMSIADKMDYVFSPVEMTAEQRAEYDAAVQAGSLTAGTPVVARDRQQFLTARYGLASAAPRGKMSVWSDDNGSVAVAFRESGTNMPTRSPDVRMLPQEGAGDAPSRNIPMSAVNVLHNDSAVLPKPSKKRGNDSVAKDLEQAAIEHWGRKLTSKDITEQEIQQIIDLGVDEFIAAFSASGKTASNWYSTAIEAAMAVAAVIHPEFTDAAAAAKAPGLQKYEDPVHAANLAMKLALAITSQNLSVELNTRFAEEQFDIFRNTGSFDYSKVYGEKAESISGNLNSANILLRQLGSKKAEAFIQAEFTIEDLNEAAEAILGRKASIAGKVDDVVNGAALFGPKIGQGFLQNIMGRFSPVTIDLWLRRTWGRWTGDVVGGGANSETLARMLDAARESGLDLGPLKGVRSVDRKRKSGSNFRSVSDTVADRLENDVDFNAQVYDVAKNLHALGQKHFALTRLPITSKIKANLESGNLSYKEFIHLQERTAKKIGEEFKQAKKSDSTLKKPEFTQKWYRENGYTSTVENAGDLKPNWSKAATVIKNSLKPIDAPGPQDRRVISRVVNAIQEKLTGLGYETTNADVQAVLWYPEKDLWAKLRGESESNLKSSYDEQFINIARQRGLGEEAIRAAEAVTNARSGTARTGGPDGQGPAGKVHRQTDREVGVPQQRVAGANVDPSTAKAIKDAMR